MNIKRLWNRPVNCSAVIVAAGSSQRMGFDKTMADISGIPVIIRTLRIFENAPQISEIIVVAKKDKITEVADLIKKYEIGKVTKVIAGGETRTESCLAGVSAVSKTADLIAIHDGARPFVSQQLIAAVLDGAKKYRAAVPGTPVTDTLKSVSDGFITGDVDRDTVVRIQTPQIFDADLIRGALTYLVEHGIAATDDSTAVGKLGFKVKIIPGEESNIKLTTPADLDFAKMIIKKGVKV